MGLVCPFPIRSISTAPYLSESEAEEKPCLAATFSGQQLLPSRIFLRWRQPRPENSLRPISRYAAEHVKTISAAQRSRPKETTTKTAVNHEKTAYSGCFGTPSETRTHYIPLRSLGPEHARCGPLSALVCRNYTVFSCVRVPLCTSEIRYFH